MVNPYWIEHYITNPIKCKSGGILGIPISVEDMEKSNHIKYPVLALEWQMRQFLR